MEILKNILHTVYPPYCVLCQGLLPVSRWDKGLCPSCESDPPFITGAKCRLCGRGINSGDICDGCMETPPLFSGGDAVFSYDDVKKTIAGFKYGGTKDDGIILGRLMAKYFLERHEDWLEELDMIVAVPLFKKKERARGFNQGEILAGQLSLELGLPMKKELLIRKRQTTPQSRLAPKERRKNVEDAFEAGDCDNARILLVDDIFTTGSTLNACCRALYRSGAADVRIFCLSVAG